MKFKFIRKDSQEFSQLKDYHPKTLNSSKAWRLLTKIINFNKSYYQNLQFSSSFHTPNTSTHIDNTINIKGNKYLMQSYLVQDPKEKRKKNH